MVDRLVAVNDADYRLPDPVLGVLASDFGDPSTSVGEGLVELLKKSNGKIPASAFGVQANTGTDQSAALHAAFTAAEAAGGGFKITLPPGIVTIAGTFPLAGYSSCLEGAATTAKAGMVQQGTVLRAISQTGPVLNFTGYLYPRGQRGRVAFSDFAVAGDNTAGSAKKGIYLDTGEGGSSSVDLRNITIYNTGGVGLHVKDHYLAEFDTITVCTPVSAAANDVPYVLLEGANGNRYYGLGIRSLVFDDTADFGVSGAVRLLPGTTFQHHQSLFVGMWFENMHAPTNSSLVVTQSNGVAFTDTQFFDCYKVAGATGTTYFRVESPSSQNYGGNIIRGLIPGKGNGTTEIDAGVRLQQPSNHVSGVKGSGGNNVIIDSGVQYSFVQLGGALVAGNNNAFTDNSGNNTNTLIDAAQGAWVLGSRAGAGYLRMTGAYQGNTINALGTLSANAAISTLTGQNVWTMTLAANISLTAITANSSQAGRQITLMITQDGTGSRTLSWPATVKFAGGTAPTLTTTAGKTDTFSFVYNGTNWIETSRAMNI